MIERVTREGVRDWLHYRTSPFEGPSRTQFAPTSGTVVRDFGGYELELDLSDPGIQRELYHNGFRESISYWAYRRAMRAMDDDPVVLEIGCNIGYYALAAVAECPDATVLCADISERNVQQCRANARRNGMESNVDVMIMAISDHTGGVDVEWEVESNLHAVTGAGGDTPSATVAHWLDGYGVDPGAVDVVRMDVEGHESAIVGGMSDELDPQVIHCEYHPTAMGEYGRDTVLEWLSECSARIQAVALMDRLLSTHRLAEPRPPGWVRRVLPANKSVEVVGAAHEIPRGGCDG